MSVLEQLNVTNDTLLGVMRSYPWESREAYGAWMAQHYWTVEATMRMLELAAGHSRTEEEHAHWFGHLRGEINHHKLFLHDAKRVGVDILKTEPLPLVTAMVFSVQGGIMLRGSHWLLGQALVLEGMAVNFGAELADRLKVHGKSAFLETHVEDDLGDDGHYEAGIRYMLALPPEKQDEAAQAIKVTGYLYAGLIGDLKSGSGSTSATGTGSFGITVNSR